MTAAPQQCQARPIHSLTLFNSCVQSGAEESNHALLSRIRYMSLRDCDIKSLTSVGSHRARQEADNF